MRAHVRGSLPALLWTLLSFFGGHAAVRAVREYNSTSNSSRRALIPALLTTSVIGIQWLLAGSVIALVLGCVTSRWLPDVFAHGAIGTSDAHVSSHRMIAVVLYALTHLGVVALFGQNIIAGLLAYTLFRRAAARVQQFVCTSVPDWLVPTTGRTALEHGQLPATQSNYLEHAVPWIDTLWTPLILRPAVQSAAP